MWHAREMDVVGMNIDMPKVVQQSLSLDLRAAWRVAPAVLDH